VVRGRPCGARPPFSLLIVLAPLLTHTKLSHTKDYALLTLLSRNHALLCAHARDETAPQQQHTHHKPSSSSSSFHSRARARARSPGGHSRSAKMFYSTDLLSSKTPLGVIW
jgi:hypothetical protein